MKGYMSSEPQDSCTKSFFSDQAFKDQPLPSGIHKALEEMNMTSMSEIQAKSIPKLLQGRDVLGSAKTGSGKTLAFLVPALSLMYQASFLPRNGTGTIVISPTRELALQIYDVAIEVSKYLPQTHGCVMGGAHKKTEAARLIKGVNLLIATPGRLLDHLQNTRGFVVSNLLMLIVDEADRILEIGFEDELSAILELIPQKRQTALFSATQTTKVADLARLSLSKPVLVEVQSPQSTVEGLHQGYVLCEPQNRFVLLYSFLKRSLSKKVMVFMSTCVGVRYFEDLLNYIDIPVISIHGKKKQAARMTIYHQFCEAETGILLCTDVAARGLDIPAVDWIVQFDPPDDPREYIHRVGRTARGAAGKGRALLFLMKQEMPFLNHLKEMRVTVEEFEFKTAGFDAVKKQHLRITEQNFHLNKLGRDAFKAFLHAYGGHTLKDVFSVKKIDVDALANGFGFPRPPVRVELARTKELTTRKRPMKTQDDKKYMKKVRRVVQS
ncbi:MAG: uncharacterized protein KVP18_001702 [Porospora cf. gigantea A]|uniref:uncharacterized protein n=1 Tax=Porospora cf. gigantea A TaxID=2853593 RepID=UPI00355A0907|nr:MAG: hypothetical protein KVP18_001702 [Porospora cf. gigantea A]